ncbi:creatininase family protein [Candidatus Aerophobetes bacterium]|nr:creatininase family protein [Candidatus Aerophobetes bacterium]
MRENSEAACQDKVFLHKMSWVEVKQVARENTVAIIPTGSIEQHGPHLPLATDSYIGYELCKRLEQKLAGKLPFIITPPAVFGASSHHLDFPGTLSLNINTYIALMQDLCNCLVHHGFKRILLLNSHGGNIAPLNVVIRNIRDQHRIIIATATYWVVASEEIARIRESGPGGIAHAGELETSCMLIIKPELVKEDLFENKVPTWKTDYILLDLQGEGKVSLAQHLSDFTPTGVIGNPLLASRKKGQKFLEAATNSLADFIVEFATWKLGAMVNNDEEKG